MSMNLHCIVSLPKLQVCNFRSCLDGKPLTERSLRIVFLLECLQLREAGSVDGGICLVAKCEIGIAAYLVSMRAF
jgi:hypothetical protein